jgi:hypothetical protein
MPSTRRASHCCREEPRQRVAAVGPDAEDHVPAFERLGHQLVHLGGRRLQVGVELHHPVIAGVLEAGRERRLQPEVAREGQIGDAWVGAGERLDPVESPVAGAVIDEQQLDIVVAAQLGGDALVGEVDTIGLVAAGHDGGDADRLDAAGAAGDQGGLRLGAGWLRDVVAHAGPRCPERWATRRRGRGGPIAVREQEMYPSSDEPLLSGQTRSRCSERPFEVLDDWLMAAWPHANVSCTRTTGTPSHGQDADVRSAHQRH